MTQIPVQVLALSGNKGSVAYRFREGKGPCVLFCGGFLSDMEGTKASFLDNLLDKKGQAYLRFDYRGHGQSSGDYRDCTMSDWLEDTLLVMDKVTDQDFILVGSSMGGWTATLAALACPSRVKGLLLLAPALDFTRHLIWEHLSVEEQKAIQEKGFISFEEPGYPAYVVTKKLIEDGEKHLLMDKPLPMSCPVRILQGTEDTSVPEDFVTKIAAHMEGDVHLHIEPGAGHGFSRPSDLLLIEKTLQSLIDGV